MVPICAKCLLDKYKDPPVREDRRGPNLWSTGYSFQSNAGQLRWQSEPLKASEAGKMCKNKSLFSSKSTTSIGNKYKCVSVGLVVRNFLLFF